ncbi:hypothetical protein H7347_10490 [Corynebacterium sp. zg-331]|uniref:hypothetical protein n=1 Tax=unclassified Corynebacterium TaxID=2624378 RepID=UPI00128D552F|nr:MULTISPECIES: hypothetical protein [unclassified Corynebacterium]MBC3186981.1 hypothetical protein [Corynebacterium sp. zg-331]MPV53457.1 hypothetical protein [Corynebacterium sp. zg331]
MMKLRRISASVVAAFTIAVPSVQIAQAEELNLDNSINAEALPTAQATYEVSELEDGALLVEVENAKFSHSPDGNVTIVDRNGDVLETLPSDLADYEIVGRSTLVASEPGTGYQGGTSFRGICPLGRYDHGGCRGGGVAKGAAKGIITGGAGGCAAGAVPGMAGGPAGAGAGCLAGVGPGAIAGGVGGAIQGATGW